MKRFTQQLMAFVRRDIILLRSYRLAFLMNIASIIFSLITYYYLSLLFQNGVGSEVKIYADNYFAFVLPGIALSNTLLVVLNVFSGSLGNEQVYGSLEILLQAPISFLSLLFSLGAFAIFQQFFVLASYFILSYWWFDLSLLAVNWGALIVILLLSFLLFWSLGVLSAAFIMVFKRGNPLTWLFTTFSILISGVYYPVEKLPHYLQFLAQFIPLTICLRSFRLAFGKGAGFSQLSGELTILALLCLLFLPLAVFSFRLAVNFCKIKGTLTHY